jgi:proteasome accessory factor C
MSPKNTSEIPQQTVLRILQLVRHLATPPAKSIPQLATWLGVDKRSIYRYLKVLEELGYCIEKDFENRYFLFENKRIPAQFTAEESQLVQRILSALPRNHPLTESIRRKVYLTSELIPIADELMDLHRARVVQQLAEAIADRRQVQLLKYQSTNSDQITDRTVEPLGFSENYAQVDAYELSSQKIKSFKIQRIQDVRLLEQVATHLPEETTTTDAFGFTGNAFTVSLRLSTRAYRLLIEEYPTLRPFTSPLSDAHFPYRFVGEVRSEIGLGRFILGLPSEIEVESPQSLKDYLNGRIAGVKW